MPQPRAGGVDASVVGDANVAYIRRLDPEIEEVLATSAHVVLYVMPVETTAWVRKNVEGSLFVLKRKTAPRFQLAVLNKLSTENFYENIHAGLAFECNPPYLLYTQGDNQILGIWFFEEPDLAKVEAVLKRIQNTMPAEQPAGSQPATAPLQQPQQASSAEEATSEKDDSFWDMPVKPNAAGADAKLQADGQTVPQQQRPANAKALAAAQAQAALAQHTAQQAPQPDPTAHLNALFKKAKQKAEQQQQQAQEAVPAMSTAPVDATHQAQPLLLTPSFFKRAAPPANGEPQPKAHADAAAAAAPTPNPLAKLFANAGKAAAATAAQPQAGAATPTAAGDFGGDRERLRALLHRVANNNTLLDMLCTEIKSVGLL